MWPGPGAQRPDDRQRPDHRQDLVPAHRPVRGIRLPRCEHRNWREPEVEDALRSGVPCRGLPPGLRAMAVADLYNVRRDLRRRVLPGHAPVLQSGPRPRAPGLRTWFAGMSRPGHRQLRRHRFHHLPVPIYPARGQQPLDTPLSPARGLSEPPSASPRQRYDT